MSLYSPQEREEYDRTGQRPGYESARASRRSIRTRLATIAGIIAFVGLLQLLLTAAALATTAISAQAALVNTAIAATSLALAVLLFLLYRAASPAPRLTAAALALAGTRAVIGIVVGVAEGNSAFVTIVLPLLACGIAVYLIVMRYRELQAT
jgi:hypothetical protein